MAFQERRDRRVLADAWCTAERLPQPVADRVLVVPVPSTPSAVRRRGGDPLRALVVETVRGLREEGAEVLAVAALFHCRPVEEQSSLDRTGRAENVRGALAARCRLDGHRVIVVDDVVTTGATLAEATRALEEAGAVVIAAVTMAATPPGPVRRRAPQAERT